MNKKESACILFKQDPYFTLKISFSFEHHLFTMMIVRSVSTDEFYPHH